jgi:hypothetical protein
MASTLISLPCDEVRDMSEVKSALAENFSLTKGGPLYRLLVRMGRGNVERRRVVVRALLAVLIAWFPLLISSLVQGLAIGPQIGIPFVRDFAVNVRFLIALPILILAESGIGDTWRILVLQFLRSGLVGQNELPSFEAVIEKITQLRDRVLPEAIIFVLALVPSLLNVRSRLMMGGVSNWHFIGPAQPSWAGWWFHLVSMPIFRFLLLRWVWRMFLWTSFLWRTSKLHLRLVATHTDMAAGLGFLSEGQKAFSPIIFAGGAVIAGQVGNAIAYQGKTLSSMKSPMIAYGVLAILILVVPLLVVAPVLHKIKRRALREFGALVTIHDQLFDTKWILNNHSQDETILGNPDASSLIDLGASFTVIRQMSLVPIDKPTLFSLAAASALPMIPVILLVTPANQLVKTVLKMLG